MRQNWTGREKLLRCSSIHVPFLLQFTNISLTPAQALHLAVGIHYASVARKLSRIRTLGKNVMRNKLLSGTACAALCLVSFSGAARSATLDDVMARLDKIEKENAELRAKVRSLSAAKPMAAAPAAPGTCPTKFKGNPALHASF